MLRRCRFFPTSIVFRHQWLFWTNPIRICIQTTNGSCALLRQVAEERGTQILLTTHSRRVVDALIGAAKFLWVRQGSVEVAGVDDEIGILLDIGALDVKERAGQPSNKAIVLTEDEIVGPLEVILWSSGFDPSTTAVLPYYGVTGIKQLRPLVKMIRSTNTQAKIVPSGWGFSE